MRGLKLTEVIGCDYELIYVPSTMCNAYHYITFRSMLVKLQYRSSRFVLPLYLLYNYMLAS